MSTEKLAFMIGLLGSVHCIGMCGPLAFAVPSLKQGWAFLVLDKLLYQLGRIISYCFSGSDDWPDRTTDLDGRFSAGS
jgi:sulfite exporter TauE/SafE